MKLLLIAPNAPPKNSAESIQVGRFLKTLDPTVNVTLVTTPIVKGWVWQDRTLAVSRSGMKVISIGLPAHRFSQRVLSNRRLSKLHVPDENFWLPIYARKIARHLKDKPDVIYSRSTPFSSALLALRLKRILQCPWLMHLSDPWAGSPYREKSKYAASVDMSLETGCVSNADLVTLTTPGQADFYRERYPENSGKFGVAANMMTHVDDLTEQSCGAASPVLRIVYTGALYGNREPSTLLRAIKILQERDRELSKQIKVDFYGNMSSDIAASIDETVGCKNHGPVSAEVARRVQQTADVLLTIEPSATHPLHLHFMPSKNLDYIATRKPILAITPRGSETSRLCASGYGWSTPPDEPDALVALVSVLVDLNKAGRLSECLSNPSTSPFIASSVTNLILRDLKNLASQNSKTITAI